MNAIHESLTDTEEATVEIESTAAVIKPVFGYGRKLVDELRLHIEEDGVHYEAVDPTNVAMVGLDVPAEAFDVYNVEETTIAVNTKSVMGALRAGRQKQGDKIQLSIQGDRLSSVVQRDYDGTQMDLQNQIRLIDPDMIRSEPDIPNLHLPGEAEVPRKLFEDVCEQVDTYSSHVSIESEGDDLVFNGKNDEEHTRAVVSDVVDNEESEDLKSVFSLDYFKHNAIKAFKTMGADELTVKFGQEFPVRIEFTTELNGAEVSGWWFQAPRIHKED